MNRICIIGQNFYFLITTVHLLFSILLIPGFLHAQGIAGNKEIRAVRIDQSPRIDGYLNDPAWEIATVVNEFYQREPDTGQPVSEKTDIYIFYDERTLYIGFRCFDDPKRITAKELKRDISLGEDDRVQVIIDTYHDQRNGFWFQIGPRGSIGDALVSENGAAFNKEWDGLWEGRAKIQDFGWEAEIAIPFKTLRFRPGQGTWGIKFIRNIRRRLEASYWPEANLNSYRFQISDAGLLTGLEGMSQGYGLDIRPYGLVGLNQKNGEKNELVYNFGGDIFYQIGSGLNAALTINTDFAQTEVDGRQVNLTRFALFFPEKRQFFLDGANYFNFGFNGDDENRYGTNMIPYFSRRIGLDADGNPIPIIAGLKIAGQTGKWNIGALNITDKTDTSYRNFTVARVTRNIGKQSYVGFLGTKGDAIGAEGNWLTGLDFKVASSKFRGSRNLTFTAFGLKSNTIGLAGKDFSYGADIAYPNDFLNIRLGYQEIGENFRAGIGFIPRIGIRNSYGELFVGPRPNKMGIMKINTGGMINLITDMKNNLLTRDIFIKPVEFEFLSGEKAEYSLSNTFEHLDADFEIFPSDSITISAGSYDFWEQGVELSTAPRRNMWIAFDYTWGKFFDGSMRSFDIKAGYKIGVPFFIGIEYEQNHVDLPEGMFTTRVYRINADVYFSPDISLSNYIQYDNVTEKWGWQSRFRWILKPGNEVFLVWNSVMQSSSERDRMIMEENTVRFKVNYNFRF
ncbi:MAG: carbohydrate binding family 9 domain-containing protein [Cyclobacteriaceae bacterium]|nr:carbohydrate binding family 9 domain-containing protein [Cyclobacteriaceae bacterium]